VARVMFFSVERVVVPGRRRGTGNFFPFAWVVGPRSQALNGSDATIGAGLDFAQARLLYNGPTPADACYYGSSNFGLENIKDDR